MSDGGTDDRSYRARGIHRTVLHELGRAIVGGKMPAGQPLPRDAELIERFGVSRTAIREAVKVLAAKGLVEARQKVGTIVRPRGAWNLLDPDILGWLAEAPVDDVFVRDLTELRQLIEPAVARAAARHATAEDLRAIEDAVATMERSLDDEARYFAADLAFHRALFRACHNELLEHLGSIVSTLLGVAFRLQHRSLISPDEGSALHRRLYEQIARRDPDAAEVEMHRIIGTAHEQLVALKRRTPPEEATSAKASAKASAKG